MGTGSSRDAAGAFLVAERPGRPGQVGTTATAFFGLDDWLSTTEIDLLTSFNSYLIIRLVI